MSLSSIIKEVYLSDPLQLNNLKAHIPTRADTTFIFIDIGKLLPLLNGAVSDGLMRSNEIANPLINCDILDIRHSRLSLESLIFPTLKLYDVIFKKSIPNF